MGDLRADIKLQMTLLGKTYKEEMWVNYFDNGDGIDDRIVGCFADWYADALGRYRKAIRKQDEQRAKELIEQEERNWLKKLKKKYYE